MLRIGFSSCFFHADPTRAIFKGKTLLYLEKSVSEWIMAEGALAYLIPQPQPGAAATFDEYAKDLDGLVLQGGSDLWPGTYGEEPLRPEWSGDAIRDRYEIELLRAFIRSGKPVLGICRGMQLINVAMGGTLYQDIATQLPDAGLHRDWDIYCQHFHTLRILPGTGLSKLYPGVETSRVNSVHHQAIKDLGKDLVVEARSEGDQVIEAIRWQGSSYVFGVQWHPEFHDRGDKEVFDDSRILKEFLKNATEGKK